MRVDAIDEPSNGAFVPALAPPGATTHDQPVDLIVVRNLAPPAEFEMSNRVNSPRRLKTRNIKDAVMEIGSERGSSLAVQRRKGHGYPLRHRDLLCPLLCRKSILPHRQPKDRYAPSSSSKTAIGSLALGVYEGDKLRHVGRVGTGFTHDMAEELFDRLQPLVSQENPFANELDALARRQLVFVKPQLVAEVEFRAWSGDGNLRHASFRGLREDKPAAQVVKEGKVEPAPKAAHAQIKLTHPDRLYWPEEGVTKQGLVDYYADVWRLMAPFVVDRPLALVRCPDGIGGPHFFQKHGWRGMNRYIDEITDPKDKGGKPALRILDFDGLAALAQSGCLEIHPWGTTTRNWEQPDMITMDLDPAEDVEWTAVIDAARELKERIEGDGLAAFVKTSGGKGLHVVIPLKPKARWPKAKAYAKRLASDMAKDDPARYIAVATKAKRKGRIFIDYLRNGRGSTAVAAYSTRARPGAPISMPLDWSELTGEIGPAHFTVSNIGNRLQGLRSDPWTDFFEAAKPLP